MAYSFQVPGTWKPSRWGSKMAGSSSEMAPTWIVAGFQRDQSWLGGTEQLWKVSLSDLEQAMAVQGCNVDLHLQDDTRIKVRMSCMNCMMSLSSGAVEVLQERADMSSGKTSAWVSQSELWQQQ